MRGAAVAKLHIGAHRNQQVALSLNIANVRNVFQNHRFIGKDGGGHGRQGGILCATDADATHQGIAAANYKFIHKAL